jgi:outer membrane protein TolC
MRRPRGPFAYLAALALPVLVDPARGAPQEARQGPEAVLGGLLVPVEGDELLGPGRAWLITLDAAYSLALQRNLGLRVQELAVEGARYGAQSTWGAFDWRFSANAGYTDSKQQRQNIFAALSPTVNEDTLDYGLGLDKLLLTGGTLSATWGRSRFRTDNQTSVLPEATTDAVTFSLTQPLLRGAWERFTTSTQEEAEIEVFRQQEVERRVRQDLLLAVSNAYWDLVAAREQLDVALSNLAVGEEQARQERLRLEAGVGTEVDVLQADAQVALRVERRIFFEFLVRQAMDSLKQLLLPGTSREAWELVLVPATPLPAEVSPEAAPPWTECMRFALDNRAELREQRLLIGAAEVRHTRTRNERLSSLDLQLSATGFGFDESSTNSFEEAAAYDFPTYSAAFVYSIPLENTTARNAERAAWAELRAARLTYDDLESSVVAEVRQAARQVVYQAEAVNAATKSLELARRQLEAEQARYAQQLTTTFQVLSLQQQLLDAESQERRTRVEYARALITLDSALGVLGETVRR